MGAEEIILTSLEEGPGIVPFKLGPSKIISHYHSFLQTIDLDHIRVSIDAVRNQIINITPELNNKTRSLYEPHIQYLQTKIDTISDQLQSFEPNRVKRGLINGLGSVIKSISGNLDYTDAIRYDHAIKNLQENENKLINEINSHISLNKRWATQNTNIINKLVENQNKIRDLVNDIIHSDAEREMELVKYAHLAQFIIILTDNIDIISNELVSLENLLGFIRANSNHHSMLKLDTFKEMTKRLHQIYNSDQILSVSFREYLDVIKLGYYYTNRNVVLVFKIPIIIPKTYTFYKLSPAPNKNDHVLIPSYPYIAIHDEDFMYIETECPKSSLWYLCEDKLNHRYTNQFDCIHHLISTQQLSQSCVPTRVILKTGALEQLDERNYIISLPNTTKVRTSCSENQYNRMQGSYLATIPKGCTLQTPEFTITNIDDRIKGQVLKIMNLPDISLRGKGAEMKTIRLDSINLQTLSASNAELSLEPPLSTNNVNDDVIYHTTIPLYSILFCAGALSIGLALRHYLKKNNSKLTSEPNPEAGIYAEIQENRKSHPGPPQPNLSALFSRKPVS